MSEYQYYEFQAIDRPLTPAEREAICQLSSRVRPTPTSANFTYSHGDFPGDAKQVLAQYFDIMYYIANWGTQQLTFRFPKSLIDPAAIEPYCVEDAIDLIFVGDWAILDWQFAQEEGFSYWIEGEGTLSELVELRREIIQQDYRGLYLAWLKAITLSEDYSDIDKSQLEPPVPPGLQQLSLAQNTFKETFEVDEYLLTVASSASRPTKTTSDESIQQAIAQLSRSECDAFLLRLAQGEANLSAKFKQKLSQLIVNSPVANLPRRTVQQLLDLAVEEEEQAEQRRKQEEQAKHIQEMQNLAKREAQVWNEVDLLLQKAQVKNYEQAILLLTQLRDLAEYQNQYVHFQEKINWIYQQYSKRSGLIGRLRKAGL
jgi:hypothetical protein